MIYYDKKNCGGMKKSRIFAVEKKYVFMGEILFKRKIYDQLLK